MRGAKIVTAITGALLMAVAIVGVALGVLETGATASPDPSALNAGGEPAGATGEVPATHGVLYGPRPLGSAVYPNQELPLNFSHRRHLQKNIGCEACHTKVRGSTRTTDFNFPKGAACDTCHGKNHPRPASAAATGAEPRCQMCHVGAKGTRVTRFVRAPAASLTFSHEAHLARGQTCATCHKNMDKVGLATAATLPREADCLACHDGIAAPQTCATCHAAATSGRLVTRARDDRISRPLVPRGSSAWGMAHDLAFVEDHAAVAKGGAQACASCHDEAFCQDCHAGSIRPLRIHAGDYLTLHALDARARTSDCSSCHREQTFCLGCHDRLGFSDRSGSAFGVSGGRAFHPEGFVGPAGTQNTHAFAAARNMSTCVSCHSEDSCLACHATTQATISGLNITPHGPGFANSTRCSALESRNRRVCLKCHAPGTPALDCLP